MNEEQWLNKVKNKLANYEEPIPTNGWEGLIGGLPAAKPQSARHVWLHRYGGIAVAAAVLVAVSTIGIWLLSMPSVETHLPQPSTFSAAAPASAVFEADVLPTAMQPHPEKSIASAVKSPRLSAMVADATTPQVARTLMSDSATVSDATSRNGVEMTQAITVEETENTTARQRKNKKDSPRYKPSSKEKLQLPVERDGSSHKGWSLALAAGNGGKMGTAMQDVRGGWKSVLVSGGIPMSGARIDDTEPYWHRSALMEKVEHHQPVSVGVNIRKNLPHGFSLETGLTYTYMASDVYYDSNEILDQKLHYMGIPLRANWNFVDKRAFTLYVSAGGAMEKCVYGKIAGRKYTPKDLQFSVMSAVGAQYNINQRLALYVEPGLSYYFDDGSLVETIRKENPCNFTLQGGIRLMY